MNIAKNIQELIPRIANPISVALCLFENNLQTYERMKGQVDSLAALPVFIRMVQDFHSMLVILKEDVITRIEQDADRTVTIALETMKQFSVNPTLLPEQKVSAKKGTDRILKETGIVADCATKVAWDIFGEQIKQTEDILRRAYDLQRSF